MFPYNPFAQQKWKSPFDVAKVTFEPNDLYSEAPSYPVIHDISTDCFNTPTINGFSCDLYIGGEFKLTTETFVKDSNTANGVTYNLVKWDANLLAFDLLSPSPDFTDDYMRGPVRAVVKKDIEVNIFTTWHTDKKIYVGGEFPYGIGLIPMWEPSESEKPYILKRQWIRLGLKENMIVNDIAYRGSNYDDEIWVGGNFQFTTSDNKFIKNFANFNHKQHQRLNFIVNDTTNGPWENFGSTKEQVEKWPESTSGKGVTSIGYNGMNKYISGWDLELPEHKRKPWNGIFLMKYGENEFKSPNKDKFDFSHTFIKQIHVCEKIDFSCTEGSMVILGANGYVKYYNTEVNELQNFGTTENPFGEDDVLEFVLSKYMLKGNSLHVHMMVILICVIFLL